MSNCGIKALQKMVPLAKISMFTLSHLARDNGIKLYLCKVSQDDLMSVARPAIFHQKDHFVFVENGEALPDGEYDGYVLTKRALGESLPYTAGKHIYGSKKLGNVIAPIVTGIASVINPILGAVVGAAAGAHQASGGAGFEGGKGEFYRIGTGALSGYAAGTNPALSAASAAIGEVPTAIMTGDYLRPLQAGLTQYGAAKISPNIVSSAKNLASGIFKPAGTGVDIAPTSASIGTPTGYTGSVTLPGQGSTNVNSARLLSIGASPSTTSTVPASAASPGQSGFDYKKILSNPNILGAAASTLLPPPKAPNFNTAANFSKAAEYLGQDNFNALPSATRDQLERYTNASISDLAKEFTLQDDKGLRELQDRKQRAVDQLLVTYSSAGQNPLHSTQAQQQLTEINRQYDQSIAEYQQQIQNAGTERAIKFKQDILAKSMEQGQFDYESAFELATYLGQDDQLRYALESKNYEALQEVLAQIFSLGLGG